MIKFIFLISNLLFGMGFFMLLERKILGLIQFRVGPNKVLFKGLIQFLMDRFKLIFKEWLILLRVNELIYYFGGLLLIITNFWLWFVYPFYFNLILNDLRFLHLIILLLIKLLFFIGLVWSLKSIYRIIRLMRIMVQLISYDVAIILILLVFIFMLNSVSFKVILNLKVGFALISLLIIFYWILRIIIEIMRVPFDFFESESELISGFNIEIGSLIFIYVFIVEYLDIIFILIFTNLLFFCWNFLGRSIIRRYLLLAFTLWVRGVYIRFRYDLMLNLLWKVIICSLIFLRLVFILISIV